MRQQSCMRGKQRRSWCNRQIRHGGEASHPLYLQRKWLQLRRLQRLNISAQLRRTKLCGSVGAFCRSHEAPVPQRDMGLAGIARQRPIAERWHGLVPPVAITCACSSRISQTAHQGRPAVPLDKSRSSQTSV